MSTSAPASFANGPESPFVIESIDALLRHDVVAARLALIEGAEANGWGAIAHRLDVAGRALAVDAGLSSGDCDDEAGSIVLIPDLDTSSWAVPDGHDAADLIVRWSGLGGDCGELTVDRVWASLALVAWLVDRAGYPAEVVV